MKILKIRRTDPNHGVVINLYPFCEEQEITPEIPYNECIKFVQNNQEDMKLYKVSVTNKRKNGKRKLYKTILAKDHSEAFALYTQLMKTADHYNYEYNLLTGDWKQLEF